MRLRRLADGEPFLPFAEGGFGTPDGKCHFRAETLDYTPPVESRHGDAALRRKYPLELISPKNDDSMNSTFGHRDAVDLQTATLHLQRGRRRARAASRLATRCACSTIAAPACCVAERGWTRARRAWSARPSVRWGKRRPDQRNVNALTSRAADRCRRRPDVLQLPGSSGEKRRLMTHTLLTERRAAVRGCCSLLLMALVLAPMALQEQEGARAAPPMKRRRSMRSVLNMGDPKVEPQLVTGFYGVEAGAWRWTAKQFTVALRPPFGAAQKGAKLHREADRPAGGHREVEERRALGHRRRHARCRPRLTPRRRLRLRPRHAGQRC